MIILDFNLPINYQNAASCAHCQTELLFETKLKCETNSDTDANQNADRLHCKITSNSKLYYLLRSKDLVYKLTSLLAAMC